MTLDKSKKYEFAGDVYEFEDEYWTGVFKPRRSWNESNFQFFAAKGLVKEVREPIVVKGRYTFFGLKEHEDLTASVLGLTYEQAAGRTFDFVVTEVVK